MSQDNAWRKIHDLRERAESLLGDVHASLADVSLEKTPLGGEEADPRFTLILRLIDTTLANISVRLSNLEDVFLRAQEGSAGVSQELSEIAYLTDADRQNLEVAVTFLKAEERIIRQLIDIDRPVSPVDRVNIGDQLLRLRDRHVALWNDVRALQGRPPVPFTNEGAPKPEDN